jgi:hypothetical protein
MRFFATFAVLSLPSLPALAEDHALITGNMQAMSDAIASGNVAVWDKYLDSNVIFAEPASGVQQDEICANNLTSQS